MGKDSVEKSFAIKGRTRIGHFRIVRLSLLCFALLMCLSSLLGAPFTHAQNSYSMTMDKTELQSGESANISYTYQNPTDWLGIYPQGSTPGYLPSLFWKYVSPLGTMTLAELLGSPYNVLSEGDYDLVLCSNGGYTVEVRVSFSVFELPAPDVPDDVDRTIIGASVDRFQQPYSLWVISDTHVKATDASRFDHALQDISVTDPNSSAIFVVGDLTNNGTQSEYNLYNSTIQAHQEKLPTVYSIVGNHDLLTGTFREAMNRFVQNTNAVATYYEVIMGDIAYIALGGEENYINSSKISLSQTQLDWLDSRLSVHATDDRPVFIFLHQGLINTTAGTYDGTIGGQWEGVSPQSTQALRSIFSKYKNLLFFSGHTHWQLEHEKTMFVDEYGTSMFNTASVSYLWNDDAVTEISGSQGYKVEVYEDKILVRGRDFAGSRWIPEAQFVVPIVHTHTFGACEVYDVNIHQRNCPCGKIQYESHNFLVDSIVPPSYTGAGYTAYVCEECGYSVNLDTVPPLEYSIKTAQSSSVEADFFKDYVLSALLPTPTLEGHTFEGWYKDEECTQHVTQIDAADLNEQGEITLFAKWTEIPPDPDTGQGDNKDPDRDSSGCQSSSVAFLLSVVALIGFIVFKRGG